MEFKTDYGKWKVKEDFNVLSEFDGMSCGQIALNRIGKKVTNYFASEIEKKPIEVTLKNYPNTKQLGDVTKIKISELPKIHLFIGGSPCQGFSFAGKQLNFDDPRSRLFFEFAADLRFIQEFINPEVKFLLENVKMKKEYEDIISRFMGVEPIKINSCLVSAQNRQRIYWTNIEGVTIPEDKGVLLKDIIHEKTDFINNEFNLQINIPEATKKGFVGVGVGDGVDLTFKESKTRRGRLMSKKSNCLTASAYDYRIVEHLSSYVVNFDKTLQILDKEVQRGKVGYFRQDSQVNRVYYIHDKSVILCGDAGGGTAKMDHYLFGCITPDRIKKNQNGQRFNDGSKFYTLTCQDRHGILIEGYIRKLTPTECERLQTVPDNYTAGVSDAQRYKMLGNGWTVDVIAHIFSFL